MSCMFTINPKYTQSDFQRLFLGIFRSPDGETMENKDGVRIIHSPFTCAVLPDFLETNALDALEAEARTFPLHRRQSDLFSLNQSDDLKTLSRSTRLAKKFNHLYCLRKFFLNDMMKWMKSVTGARLDEEEVNSTISLYYPNDYLLCHDDELDRRRIAFVLYLVPTDWDITKDGGGLELFESGPSPDCNMVPADSGEYHPWRVVRSLSPGRNYLTFFEVCSKSFHQVAEVIGKRDRLSVHGWYMSDPLPRVLRAPDPVRIPRLLPCFIEEELLFKWINPVYIDMENQKSIKPNFLSTSEIQLPQFFRKSRWEQLWKAIRGVEESVWVQEGPMDLRNISVLPYATETEVEAKLPLECREVRRLLSSEAMLLILSQMTGVSLHPLANYEEEEVDEGDGETSAKPVTMEEGEGKEEEEEVKTEMTTPRFHRWKTGMYTLLADANSGVVDANTNDDSTWRLDLFYHIGGYGTKHDKVKSVAMPAPNGDSGDIVSGGSEGDQLCWQDSWNGQIVYVWRSDSSELLRIRPEDNALSLVYYKAAECAKFVRYINATAAPLPLPGDSASSAFAYNVSLSYFHQQEEDAEENEEEEEEEQSGEMTISNEDEEDEVVYE